MKDNFCDSYTEEPEIDPYLELLRGIRQNQPNSYIICIYI